MSWDERAVVITVAPTGAEVTREDNPALPHTPREIAADAIGCAEAGASVVHLHGRADGRARGQTGSLGVETGSMNFGEDPFVTLPKDARAVVERAGELGIGLEAECFDVGHVVQAVRMLERRELPEPLNMNLVFGVPGGIDATPEALEAMLRPLPSGTHWCVTAIGRHQRRMLALGLLRGAGGIRVGEARELLWN